MIEPSRKLTNLKDFLSNLEIACEQCVFHGNSSKGVYDESLFLGAVKKMQPYIGAVQSIFDDLGVKYIRTFQYSDDETPRNIIELSVREYPDYPYNEARNILVPNVKAAIFSIEEGYYEEKSNASPLVPFKNFSFVSDARLKDIIEKDYKEVCKCLISECYKATMVLAGGLIEAILLDLLSQPQNKQNALASQKAPETKGDLEKWDLYNLIEVSVDLKLVTGIEKLGHGVRDFRNLIHPGRQLRENLEVAPEEAKIAIEVLNIVIRQLNKNGIKNEEKKERQTSEGND